MDCGAGKVITGGGFVKTPENAFNVVSASLPTNPGWKWNVKNFDTISYRITGRIVCYDLG